MKQVALNTGAQGIGRIVVAALGIGTTVTLARALGPQGFGGYSYAFTYIGLVGTLISLGLEPYAIREIVADPEASDLLLSTVVTFKFVLSVTGAVLALAIYPFVGSQGSLVFTVALTSLSLPLSALSTSGAVFNARLQMEYRALADCVTATASFFLVLAATTFHWGLNGIVAALITANAIGVATTLVLAGRFVRLKIRASPRLWARVVGQAAPIGVAGVFHQLYYRVDVVLLSAMAGSAATGLYTAGYGFFDQSVGFFSLFSASLFPVLAQNAVNHRALRFWVTRGLVVAGLASAVVIVVCVTLGGTVLTMLYGQPYVQAGTALGILSLASPFAFAAYVINSALIAAGRQHQLVAVNAIAFVVNVILNLILVPHLGFEGSAVATILTEIVVVVQVGGVTLREFANG